MSPRPAAAAAPESTRTGSGARSGLVVALAVTQTVGYGVLYYAFSVLLGPISEDLHISTATAAGALTTAVLTSGAMSIPVGRWLDARGGHALMTTGSVIGAVAVLGWSQVQNAPQLYGVFVLIGVASAMVLYEPAFAVIVAVSEPGRRAGALLTITLVAGFASSIFIPLTGQLVDAFSWRQALLILLAIYGLVTIPLHAVALRHTAPGKGRQPAQRSGRTPVRVLRDAGFWLLAAAFVLHSGALAVIALHLVLYLGTLGHPPALAAGLAGLLGLLSVTGRVVTAVTARWLPMTTVAAAILVLQGIAIAQLPLVGREVVGAVGCLVLFGLGFGVASLATPAILLDRYGADGYGTIAGTLATPVIVARASAPLGGAVVAEAAGYRAVIVIVAGACVVAGTLLALTRRLPRVDVRS